LPKEYIGCFRNTQSSNWMQLLSMDDQNSPSLCESICADRAYSRFRLIKSQCWCINAKTYSKQKVDENQCDLRCSGDSQNFCGSQRQDLSSVYRINSKSRNSMLFSIKGCTYFCRKGVFPV
jgi:hypothetical protein